MGKERDDFDKRSAAVTTLANSQGCIYHLQRIGAYGYLLGEGCTLLLLRGRRFRIGHFFLTAATLATKKDGLDDTCKSTVGVRG